MSRHAGTLAPALAICAMLIAAKPAAATSGYTGGAAAPAAIGTAVASSGGSAPGFASPRSPRVSRLSFPSTTAPGAPPAVSFEVTEAGVGTVSVTAVIRNL